MSKRADRATSGAGIAGQWMERLGWQEALSGAAGQGSSLIYYGEYRMNATERLFAVAVACAVLYMGSFIFYKSIVLSCMIALAGIAAPKYRRAALRDRRRNRLKLQFKEALFSLTSSLAAGRSPENAFRTALDDLRLLYTDPKTDILREFQVICYRLDSGEALESALHDLADRTGIEEITQFVDALTTCKRSGGDLLEVMKRTSTIIGEKIGVEGDIMVMIAQKRFEAKVMMMVPFLFLGCLNLMAPDYMQPLYSGMGYVLLTVGLALLMVCYRFIFLITKFEI